MAGRWALLSMIGLLASLSGCATTPTNPDEEIEKPPTVYHGLRGQLSGVMVWADWATRTEYPQVQLDLSRALQFRIEEKLKEKDSKKDQPPAARFVDPKSVLRYQREHPEIDGLSITEIAPRLGIQRVIYIEIEQLQTQAPESMMLLKGKAVATLRVVEVQGGHATIALEEHGINAVYPPRSPEGVPMSDKVTPVTIYEGVLTRLADKLAARFDKGKD